MERNYKLYLHTAPNGKRYYGITKQKPYKRWKGGHGYKNNPHFINAINKYGWDNIKHEVLFDNLTESEAKELEQYFIQWYDTTNREYGYNVTLGGECNSGCNHTEETKSKISKARKGKCCGENHYMYGKHPSEETRQKMSEAWKGKRCGKDNPISRSVICLTTRKIFLSIAEGSEYYNTEKTNIVKCCKGKQKSSGKYNGQKLVWRYINHKHNKKFRIKDGR